jgi:AraC-like DNA-binding protein
MTHQINIFLLLFGALQGVLLSLLFLKNEKRKVANTYFALFLIVLGLQLTFKVITKAWLMDNVHVGYLLSYKWPYLIAPLLYLYIRSRKDNSFYKTDLLHFIPFAVSLLTVVIVSFVREAYWLRPHPYADAAYQIISLMIYGFLSLRLGNPKLNGFIKMVVATETIIAITLAVMVVYYGRFPDVRLFFLVLTVLIYWISYKAISKPDLFSEEETAQVIPLSLDKNKKYAHSSLKPEEAIRIENELQQLMLHHKPYLDSGLTIDILSSKLATSRHHLSQVLNEKLNKTYGDFICELRLEEAKKRLSEPANLRFTIAAIALDSGFSAVSNFNEVFKKRYGTTPSKFRDQYLNKMSA